MGVHERAPEGLIAGVMGHVGHREVPGGQDHVVEVLANVGVAGKVVGGDREAAAVGRPADAAHRIVEPDVVADAAAVGSAKDVVVEHLAGREGRHRLAEVLLEAVVGELQALLGTVGPQVAVHAGVAGLAMLVESGAPAVVPEPAPVVLLLETDELGCHSFR